MKDAKQGAMEKTEQIYARLLAVFNGKIAMCVSGISLVIQMSILSKGLSTYLEPRDFWETRGKRYSLSILV